MSWQHALICLGSAFAVCCFLCSDWPRRTQHRRRRKHLEQHHSYFASSERDYAE